MARFSFLIAAIVAGCSSSATTAGPDASTDGGTTPSPEGGKGDTDSGPSTFDAASETGTPADDATVGDSGHPSDSGDSGGDASDGAVCNPPQGATCPTTAGNCLGIGNPCTKGGGQCAAVGKSCDLELDPGGAGICISYLICTPGQHDCGAGASCCKTAMTQNVAVCLPNQCIVSDCTAEP